MCMGNFEDNISYIIGFMLAFIGTVLFYALVIQPRDEAGFAIMSCMGDDHSYESYEACVQELKP